MPGLRARKPAKIGGSASALMISLAVTRTTPRSVAAADEAERASAAAAAAIASPCGTSAFAAAVGLRPRGERMNRVAPSASSSASMWRPTVGWVRPSLRAAPLEAAVARDFEEGPQFVPGGFAPAIQKCIVRSREICNSADVRAALRLRRVADRRARYTPPPKEASNDRNPRALVPCWPAGGRARRRRRLGVWRGVRAVLRLEGAAAFAAAVALYAHAGFSWPLFVVLILAPDLAMLAYLIGPRAGAFAYNLVHTYALALPLGVAAFAFGSPVVAAIGLIWIAHIGMDRMLGYGLKYRSGFGDTHLGRFGAGNWSDPMRVHAIQTGRVRIKTSQIVGSGHGLRRRLAPLLDNEWSPWLPTLVYAIEHRDGVILVDAGASAANKSLPRWHPYFRNAVRFDIEPDEEAGPQLRAIGIRSGDVRRVVLTHLHIDHDGGLGAFPASEVSGQSGRASARVRYRGPASRLSAAALAQALRSEASCPRRRRLWPVCALEAPDRRRRDRRRRHARPYARSFLGHRRGWRQGRLHRRRRLLQRGDDACRRDRRRERETKAEAAATLAAIRAFAASRPTIYLPAHDPEAAQRLAERRAVGAPQSITACAAASREAAAATAFGERISASSGKAQSEMKVMNRKSFE